jgi:ParB-like chromosome segregation protein Spo0J
VKGQPVSSVEWVDAALLRANDYNPNKQAPPEFRLLRVSLMASGWTQPIVIRDDYEIVDGFHRWLLVTKDKEVAALTDGKVPVVRLREVDPAEQRMATIRHNRARGTHAVIPMADIVASLIDDYELEPEQLEALLQMDFEEVDRLYDRGEMTKRGSADALGKGWVPK